ncbi:unnamed protein product [Pneumocystis jirovecii]|uniref:Ribosomal protein S12 n=1 Tax=Pneumocystis jirovecii TaxID=42068 RepID=L0P8A1_PNEJI|nr:unnamed protein product [Pneumocystis jirovecii]
MLQILCHLRAHVLQANSIWMRRMATLQQVIRGCRVPRAPQRPSAPRLNGAPLRRAVCDRKPNSAQRKVARVRLSCGRKVVAYIPGEGHNVQEHAVVVLRGGRVQDLPGVRYHIVRGAGDVQGVVERRKDQWKEAVLRR